MKETEHKHTTCTTCGVKTHTWQQERIINKALHVVPETRDYWPVTFRIRLKPDAKTTFVVTPELERHLKTQPFYRICSVGNGALDYTVDAPLQGNNTIPELLQSDGRIAEWHTETSAPVCQHHVHFVDARW